MMQIIYWIPLRMINSNLFQTWPIRFPPLISGKILYLLILFKGRNRPYRLSRFHYMQSRECNLFRIKKCLMRKICYWVIDPQVIWGWEVNGNYRKFLRLYQKLIHWGLQRQYLKQSRLFILNFSLHLAYFRHKTDISSQILNHLAQ